MITLDGNPIILVIVVLLFREAPFNSINRSITCYWYTALLLASLLTITSCRTAAAVFLILLSVTTFFFPSMES